MKINKIIILTRLWFFQFLIQIWSYKLQSVNNYVQLKNNYAHTNFDNIWSNCNDFKVMSH